ncbi:hypothetical protein EV421DRAFT_1715275, partial [Armillaria borealis]
FDYHYNTILSPTGRYNIDATHTNTFYIIDKVYEYAYKYGWTEVSYNFRSDGLSKGGTSHGRC